jgi:hypothetical protein
MGRLINVGCRGLDEEKVHQPILVIVKPRHPGAHGLQIVLLVGGGRVLLELQAGTLGNVGEGDGDTGRRGDDAPGLGKCTMLSYRQGCSDRNGQGENPNDPPGIARPIIDRPGTDRPGTERIKALFQPLPGN